MNENLYEIILFINQNQIDMSKDKNINNALEYYKLHRAYLLHPRFHHLSVNHPLFHAMIG